MQVGNDIFRIFCFFDHGQLVVLANGFQKKTQKTPKQEIEKALKIKEEYDDKLDKHYNQLLIIDDCTHSLKDNDIANMLEELSNNRRHLSLSIIILTQYLVSIPAGEIKMGFIHPNFSNNLPSSGVTGTIASNLFIISFSKL